MTRLRFLFVSLIVALAIPTLGRAAPVANSPDQTAAYADASSYCPDSEELAFLTLINNYRAQNGLGPLVLTQTLGAASRYHSVDMATYNYIGHTLHDGTTWDQDIRNFGYTYNTYLGENIASGYDTAASVFAAWKASSGHNANMLSANYKAIGIGRAATSTSWWYWTTDFGGYVDAAATCVQSNTTSPTLTPTVTPSATNTPKLMATSAPSGTASNTPSPAATSTRTPAATSTATPSPTNTSIPTATKTPLPTPTNATAPIAASYVSSITGSAVTKKSGTTITVSVVIRDSNGSAVSGAVVSIQVVSPSGAMQSLSAKTTSRGQASWSIIAKSGAGSYSASVVDVASSTRPYDASLNKVSSVMVAVR